MKPATERALVIAGMAAFGGSLLLIQIYHDMGMLAPMWLAGVFVVSLVLIVLEF